ncbi:CAAD domain-containing protein [Anabaena sp. FACHB-1237]|uniref:CAAD domain-containing protein n=1 Tax=Anabaena sp. FACHB-1237 TaxID=2692769 RepID=UPI00168064FF|nr:CAAD domain-containing protein [Anabaena sp. FACHB-1237]MBD2138311.1 CAAD domain-containing protein [Anabaena sp. FACHB-1237]
METQQPVDVLSVMDGKDILSSVSSAKKPQNEVQKIFAQVAKFLDKLPDYLGSFYTQNQQGLLTIVLILSAFVTVKVMIAMLNAVNTIPLLQPTFELIGLGYSLWFAFRYLLKAESRKELSEKLSVFKQQSLG